MRKLFLASATLCVLTSQAHAQGVAVIDAQSLLQEIQQVAQSAKAYLLQAQQYSQQIQTYMAFVHDPSLGAAMGLMNRAGLSNDLPVNPMAVQSLTSGVNGLSGIMGKLGTLSALLNTNYSANHVYTPTVNTFGTQAMIANGYSIAGTQGAAQSAYQDLRNHVPIIQALRDRLATATNPKDVADVQAQLQVETVWTDNLQSELAAINVNYQAARDSREQQQEEQLSKEFEGFVNEANAAGMGVTP